MTTPEEAAAADAAGIDMLSIEGACSAGTCSAGTDGHKPRHGNTCRNFAAEFAGPQLQRIAAFREFNGDVASGAYSEAQHVAPIDAGEFAAFKAGSGI